MSHIVQLDPRSPDAQTLRRVAACLREGKTIAFPTETFYALGVSAYHEPAIQKVFAIKGRMFDKPLPLIIHGESMLEEIAAQIPECARSLMRAFWPGPLTLIFKASEKIPPLLTASTGTVAVRDSSHPLARQLVMDARLPVTATSANVSGGSSCYSAGEVEHQIGDRVDMIIDGGPTPGGLPSTIVDLTVSPPRIVREGAISTQRLQSFLVTCA
jgi:L-threonylcarbamoyladenylate synthase